MRPGMIQATDSFERIVHWAMAISCITALSLMPVLVLRTRPAFIFGPRTALAQTPAIEEALYLMASSYEKLGLVELQADATRVLKQNFPNSKFISGGLGKRESAWWQFW